MIVVIPQLIRCFISTKTEIPHDYGTPGSAGATAVGGTWTVCNGTIHVASAEEDDTAT